jgi:2-oxoglutarate/2-oxoacid ferredoxin oxidoreductase subunit alpha
MGGGNMAAGINIMAGGEAGQGIQSIGGVLVKTLVRGGFNVFADQDYESRVRGGHNFYRIRASEEEVHAISPALDLLIALNKETIDIHEKEMKPGGLIVYDKEQTQVDNPGMNHFNVPFNRLAVDNAQNKIMANTVAVGAALGLAEFDFSILTGVLEDEFKRHGEKVVQDNIKAARAGYDYAEEHCKECKFPRLPLRKSDGRKMLLNAHESLCLGALVAGCKFVAGYPMTPSSNILEFMADKGREYGTIMIHVEDEISAINMAIGAGFAGLRSMVATSGGGFSLMVEGLALAGMTETPVVIVLGQRPGPATGLPTRTEQGELMYAIHAGHGEFPRAVFAAKNAVDAFYVTVKAFNMAEKYQTPVIILTDQYLSSSYESIEKFDLSKVIIDRGELVTGENADNSNYKRHLITPSGVSPRVFPGLGKALVVTDSDAHNEEGHIIEDAATRKAMVEKRMRKMEGLKKDIIPPEYHKAESARATLIGWGSTYGAIHEAADMLNRDGFNVNTLHFNQLWPFPVEQTIDALDTAGKNIVIENNAASQLAGLIKRETGHSIDQSILKYDGRPFSPQEIYDRVREEAA